MKIKLVHQYRDVIESDDKFFSEVSEQNISEETHTIGNVCVFGTRHSKNGYEYQDMAIDSLTKMTQGAHFFINHPSKSEAKERDGVRDIRDWGGVFSNPHREGEKVMADLSVRSVFWPLVKDVATMRPAGVGNSINSRVKIFKDDKGKEHVVDIDSLKSIDLVASAATTQNLFESASEKIVDDREDWVNSWVGYVEGYYDTNTIKAMIVHDLFEGMLIDKIKEKEMTRAVSKLNWQASDIIEELLRDGKKKFADKKKEIGAVLDDLESEIGKLLSGEKKPGKNDDSLMLHNKEEKEDMEWKDINIEDLRKNRSDLVDAIVGDIADAEKFKKMESDLAKLGTKVEELGKTNEELTKASEGLTKENEDLKKKLDEYETKDKATKKEALIKEKLSQAKLPTEAITDIFMKDLMAKNEGEIDESIKDRMELWKQSSGKVTNSGDERNLGDKTETKEKMEAASDKFKNTIGKK